MTDFLQHVDVTADELRALEETATLHGALMYELQRTGLVLGIGATPEGAPVYVLRDLHYADGGITSAILCLSTSLDYLLRFCVTHPALGDA